MRERETAARVPMREEESVGRSRNGERREAIVRIPRTGVNWVEFPESAQSRLRDCPVQMQDLASAAWVFQSNTEMPSFLGARRISCTKVYVKRIT